MEPALARFVIADTKPRKHIDIDLGHGLPRLYDELDEAEKALRDELDADPRDLPRDARSRLLSEPVPADEDAAETLASRDPLELPFSHAVNAVQVDPDDPLKVLRRTHHSDSGPRVEARLRRARNWVRDYAPDSFLFSVEEETPDVELTDDQRAVLAAVADAVEEGGGGDEIQNAIYETGNNLDMDLGDAFAAVYRALLDQDNGPRAGPFVAALDPDLVVQRFRELAE